MMVRLICELATSKACTHVTILNRRGNLTSVDLLCERIPHLRYCSGRDPVTCPLDRCSCLVTWHALHILSTHDLASQVL